MERSGRHDHVIGDQRSGRGLNVKTRFIIPFSDPLNINPTLYGEIKLFNIVNEVISHIFFRHKVVSFILRKLTIGEAVMPSGTVGD